MAKTKKKRDTTPDLPAMTGPGVERLIIEDIDKAAKKYEKAKDRRCAESPGELSAKRELYKAMAENRANLPTNPEGLHYYRADGVEYVLEEVLKRLAEQENKP